MGMFSWKTNDTRRSIKTACSGKPTFRVYMVDHLGNQWIEDNYEGYGVFGGKDFYELVAEMNGLRPTDSLEPDSPFRLMWEDGDYTGKMRLLGIELGASGKPYISPQLTEKPRKRSTGKPPQDCDSQGG
mgnify:FL=1